MRDVEPWFAHGLVVRKSRIHGLGLFTDYGLRKGDDILRFGGSFFHISQRNSHLVMPSTSIPLSEELVLAEPSAGERDLSDYINHSCNPNAGFRDALTLVAIKSINFEEEIVVDYTFWECDSAWRLKQPCNCGAESCRKLVKGTDWERILLADPCMRFFSPFLRRRIISRSSTQT